MSGTPLDLDWRLRLAALDAVRRATIASGGVMTRAQMTAGFEMEGERIPLSLEMRGIWKPGQLGGAGAAFSIYTASVKPGVKPKYDDQVASADGWFEYRYQSTDPAASDNRAVRRAFELRRPLIYFYGVGPGLYDAIAPVYVVADEPAKLNFRIAAEATSVGDPRLMIGGADAPPKGVCDNDGKNPAPSAAISSTGGVCIRRKLCRLTGGSILSSQSGEDEIHLLCAPRASGILYA